LSKWGSVDNLQKVLGTSQKYYRLKLICKQILLYLQMKPVLQI